MYSYFLVSILLVLIPGVLSLQDIEDLFSRVRRRDNTSQYIDCEGKSTSDCIEILCAKWGQTNAAVAKCCQAGTYVSKIQCLKSALDDPSNAGSSATTTKDDCAIVKSSLTYCNLATPGFSKISDFSVQASCLCYPYQSYDPGQYDRPYRACQKQLGASQRLQRPLLAGRAGSTTSIDSPCTNIGPVRTSAATLSWTRPTSTGISM